MLVISRRVGEAVRIDHGIVVRVLGVCGQTVRLGIEAPPTVGIRRAELARLPDDQRRPPAPRCDVSPRPAPGDPRLHRRLRGIRLPPRLATMLNAGKGPERQPRGHHASAPAGMA
jgi:carbon storage regulator